MRKATLFLQKRLRTYPKNNGGVHCIWEDALHIGSCKQSLTLKTRLASHFKSATQVSQISLEVFLG